MSLSITIESMKSEDWCAVRQIYQEGIATRANLRTEAPTWDEWDRSHLTHCRFVARSGDKVVGWIALSPVSNLAAYAGVAEISVYVSAMSRGKGIASKLMKVVFQSSEEFGIWTLLSRVLTTNTASLELHKKLGFRPVGYFERIAMKDEIWYDLMWFERRSNIAGIG